MSPLRQNAFFPVSIAALEVALNWLLWWSMRVDQGCSSFKGRIPSLGDDVGAKSPSEGFGQAGV
jgi:hypothetical protein